MGKKRQSVAQMPEAQILPWSSVQRHFQTGHLTQEFLQVPGVAWLDLHVRTYMTYKAIKEKKKEKRKWKNKASKYI